MNYHQPLAGPAKPKFAMRVENLLLKEDDPLILSSRDRSTGSGNHPGPPCTSPDALCAVTVPASPPAAFHRRPPTPPQLHYHMDVQHQPYGYPPYGPPPQAPCLVHSRGQYFPPPSSSHLPPQYAAPGLYLAPPRHPSPAHTFFPRHHPGSGFPSQSGSDSGPRGPHAFAPESSVPTLKQEDRASSTSQASNHDAKSIKPKRRRATPAQVLSLTTVFKQTNFPSTEHRARLAKELNMTPRAVQIWFQNRRQAARSRQLSKQGVQVCSNSTSDPNPSHSSSSSDSESQLSPTLSTASAPAAAAQRQQQQHQNENTEDEHKPVRATDRGSNTDRGCAVSAPSNYPCSPSEDEAEFRHMLPDGQSCPRYPSTTGHLYPTPLSPDRRGDYFCAPTAATTTTLYPPGKQQSQFVQVPQLSTLPRLARSRTVCVDIPVADVPHSVASAPKHQQPRQNHHQDYHHSYHRHESRPLSAMHRRSTPE
ncbi:hypothetical protein DFJ77DRAFT_118939 [Powellomyces hirtus]|nr:hypothetical protein DFJ77DRAFT_118939 [Powellomyces hirtus]